MISYSDKMNQEGSSLQNSSEISDSNYKALSFFILPTKKIATVARCLPVLRFFILDFLNISYKGNYQLILKIHKNVFSPEYVRVCQSIQN